MLDVDVDEDLPERPRTRAECPNGPCPWFGCRHHLAIQFITHGTGKIVWTHKDADGHPDVDAILAMPETCSLRVADGGRHRGATVARLMNVPKQRIDQIEGDALVTLRKRVKSLDPERKEVP